MGYTLEAPPEKPAPGPRAARPENPRPANPALHPENRVWGSPRFSNKTHPEEAPQSKQPHRENPSCNYEIAPGVRFYHKNYLDHVYAVSDSDGNILEHYRYSPFGQLEIYSPTGQYLGNSTKNSAIGNTRTWNTRILDPDTGLYMYKYRHYSAELGRFISRDPIAENSGSNNLYAFVGNNPMNGWDALGLSAHVVEVGDFESDTPKLKAGDEGYKAPYDSKSTKANLDGFMPLVKSLKATLEGMTDAEFKRLTTNGITFIWSLSPTGLIQGEKREPQKVDRKKLIKWLEIEESSKVVFVEESPTLKLREVEEKVKEFSAGHPAYNYDSFALVMHGMPGKGSRLGHNNRTSFASASKIANGVNGYRSKAFVSCGFNDKEKSFIHQAHWLRL